MRLILLSVLVLAANCRPRAESHEAALARQAKDQEAAEQGIAAQQERFALHYNSGHADSLATFYATDAHLMPANLPEVVGAAAIQAAFAQAVAAKGQLKLVTEEIVASGELAVERGIYEETYTPAGATQPVTERGKYLVHWRRIAEQWRIVEHIANSDQPVAGVPGTTPRP